MQLQQIILQQSTYGTVSN